MSKEQDERVMSTADLVAAAHAPQQDMRQMQQPTQAGMERPDMPQQPVPQQPVQRQDGHEGERLAALFPPDMAQAFREHWSSVQIGFVDDPRGAVQQADELVAKVMKSLAERFANQRAGIESELGQNEQASTENMRMALRSYRSFFERLLSL
jgi:hypothetical protein